MRDLGDAFSSLMSDLRDKQLLTGLAPAQQSAPLARAEPPSATSRGSSRLVIGGSAPRGAMDLGTGAALDVGFVLANRYRVEATLGSGGLGVVYRVHDRVIGESVALKVLRRSAVSRDLQAPSLLAEELRVSRRITHRNVVRMHDIGEADGVTFLTMEFVDGASLAAIIESRGALHPAAVLSIARQLLRALSVMHGEGVVHGDLKPANLLVGPDGILKVSDFGISRLVRSAHREGRGDDDRTLSRPDIAGAVIGTPEYMAPEQLIGAAAKHVERHLRGGCRTARMPAWNNTVRGRDADHASSRTSSIHRERQRGETASSHTAR